ncbi:MAG: hypothetical protein ACM3MK_14250 [Chitinophagales bacterium]
MAKKNANNIILRALKRPEKADSVKVQLNPLVAEEVRTIALSDLKRELGGVLLGTCRKEDSYLVNVEAIIEAKYTDAAHTSLTFTHRSWDYINQERETRYPHLKIVGWFHTHPGFGVFLSTQDEFIQKNFFDLPWQIAFVLDPINERAGLFGWQDKELVSLPYWVDDEIHEAVQPDLIHNLHAPAAKYPRLIRLGATVMLFCTLCLTSLLFYQAYRSDYLTRPGPLPGQEYFGESYSFREFLYLYLDDSYQILKSLVIEILPKKSKADKKDKKSYITEPRFIGERTVPMGTTSS